MELYCYLVIALLSVVFSINRSLVPNPTIFFLFWLTTYILLVVIVRSTFDSDIATYALAMSQSSMSIYYLKEPVVWLGQRLLFNVLQDQYLVFIVTDLIIGLILYRTFQNFKMPQYAFFSFLIFFPTVLGMQNVYRQWVATVLLLYSFSLANTYSKPSQQYLFFGLSILSHNATAIFLPLLSIYKTGHKGNWMWYCSCIIGVAGIKIGGGSKSSANTGSDLTLFYLALIAFFILLLPALDQGVIRKCRKFEYRLFSLLFVLSVCAVGFLSSAGAERVSMMCLMIAYPILASLFERKFQQGELVRMHFSLLGFVPMFLFGVSIFILT